MHALVNRHRGDPSVLALEERPTPTPGQGELLVRVHRAGLNFADLAARVGLYPDAPPFPCVVGYEIAGTVLARGAGAGVDAPAEGARVLALTRFGGQATHVCVPVQQVRELPAGVDFDTGAALPVNGLTAVHLATLVAPVRPGMKLLVHSAAGGVGTLLVQIARAIAPGCVIIGTASAGKHDALRALGVDHPIDPREEDYVARVRELTSGRGVDRVFDALGGRDWKRGFDLLRPSGQLVCFGWANLIAGERRRLAHAAAELLRMPRFSPLALMNANRGVAGVNMAHLFDEAELLAPHMDRLLELVAAGLVRPRIDGVFPLTAAAQAHARLQSRRAFGKILFACDDEALAAPRPVP